MNLGILLWNTCTAKCEHCAPLSGPAERPKLTNTEIFEIIDASFYDDSSPKIGLSGGEVFIYFDRLCEIIGYAVAKGAKVSVNTSCSWANSEKKAEVRLNKLKELGLSRLVVSSDEFHEKFINPEFVMNVVRACRKIHLEVELQFVATRKTARLADFLRRYGDDLLNVRCREIPCHPAGRAANKSDDELFLREGIPDGLCPSAILSVSADGNYMPCCNTASHLPALKVGDLTEPAVDVCRRFASSALMSVLVSDGPKSLLEAAVKSGYQPRSGYVDQCHLCYDIFRQSAIAENLKRVAIDRVSEKVFRRVSEQLRYQSEGTPVVLGAIDCASDMGSDAQSQP